MPHEPADIVATTVDAVCPARGIRGRDRAIILPHKPADSPNTSTPFYPPALQAQVANLAPAPIKPKRPTKLVSRMIVRFGDIPAIAFEDAGEAGKVIFRAVISYR